VKRHHRPAPGPTRRARLRIDTRPAPGPTRRARLRIDTDGRASRARQVQSPNCDERPAGAAITLLVVHGISLPPGEFGGDGIERLFTNRLDPAAHPHFASIGELRVSAHFLVRRDGRLLQFVSCARRAWHAGASAWRGRERCNDFSIGIELEGTDAVPYTRRQYRMLRRVIGALARRYPIEDVVGHADVAPGRKTDPGPVFDWAGLARALAATGLVKR
jgi:AmpD protein